MSDASAAAAPDGSERAIALDVFGRELRMAFDLDGAELEVDPWAADAPAQGAIAQGGLDWRGRQSQADSAAMAGALMH